MTFDEIGLWVNVTLCILSFILAAISVVTVIVSLRQNGKLLKMSSEQLSEMRKERELAIQPILTFSNPRFVVEKPRLFYTPPTNEYSLSSRFRLRMDVENISSAVAINIVCTGVGMVHDNENVFVGTPSSTRINILGDSKESLDFMFVERKRGAVFNSLREESIRMLPQGQLEVVFMNTSGGAFRMVKRYLIYPGEEELNKIRSWHSIVSSAEVEYKEEFKELRKNRENNDLLFDKLKEKVDKAAGEENEVVIECVELDDFFVYEPITIEEYKRIVQECHFGRFVGRDRHCFVKDLEGENK